MVLLVSRVSIVRIQREIRGAGQEEAFKNATKDEVVIKLDQKEGFLGSPGEEGMAVSKGTEALAAEHGWGHWRVSGRRCGEGWAGACLDPEGKCTSVDRRVFRKVEDSLFPGHDTKQP